MTKIVINRCWGGFRLSPEAAALCDCDKYGYDSTTDDEIKRDDPRLVAAVEKLGPAANGSHAKLKVVEIPDDVDWYISKYDGMEHVAERHRTWS